ncbi:hypothetical protein CEXT_45021 [Caerostris extrusa]|uniref:Uncharacterized protein n=1 Tax=Caerostris extrusa TaxID=172846 RepID=A0AAV4URG1_CAEEX|nr:hypothetical protein CEXT_45021 [Caerostris extrusa]
MSGTVRYIAEVPEPCQELFENNTHWIPMEEGSSNKTRQLFLTEVNREGFVQWTIEALSIMSIYFSLLSLPADSFYASRITWAISTAVGIPVFYAETSRNRLDFYWKESQ